EDVPEVQRRQESDEVLALATDVEHPAAEGEGDGERREHERRRDDQRLLQVECGAEALVSLHPREEPAQPGAGEDCLVRGEGVVPGRDHDEAADEERQDRGRERREEATEPRIPAAQLLVAAAGFRSFAQAAVAFFFPPTIAKPISSSETSAVY